MYKWNIKYIIGGGNVPIKFKIDVISALKRAGYNTNTIRKEKLLSEGTLQSLRNGKYISMGAISKICRLLNCQPGDIMEYVDDDTTENE